MRATGWSVRGPTSSCPGSAAPRSYSSAIRITGVRQPAWDKVIYRPISNPAARVAALLAGDVDLIEDPPTDDLERLQKDPKLTVVTKASNRIIYVALDQHGEPTPGIQGTNGKNPLLDKRVREALSLAIDRQALVARTMGGCRHAGRAAVAVSDVRRSKNLIRPPRPIPKGPRRC